MLDHYDMYLLSLCLRKERCDKKRTAWKFVFLSAGVSTFAELGPICLVPRHCIVFLLGRMEQSSWLHCVGFPIICVYFVRR